MSENKNESYEPVTFDAIKIGLASPEKIREWLQRRSNQTRDNQLQNIKA